MHEKGFVYRRKNRREPLELVPAEMDTKARKIPLLGQVNVSCTIENV